MKKILFVCLGNICRSPMAEYVFKYLVKEKGLEKEFKISSAGTSNEESGSDMHYGTKEKLNEHHIPYGKHRVRKMTKEDYNNYDYIIGMESSNIRNILRIVENDDENKVHRLLDYSSNQRDIADPWYTGNFRDTYNDILEGCTSLLDYLENNK